jgi:5'-nucleotidase/UDP-sugar diphosphatase
VNFVTPQDVEPWRVLPVVETVRKYAQELRERSDLIVVLGHIHDEQEAKAILQQVPEVSVVVVGHTHVGFKEMMNVGGRVGVLVTSYGVELGRLDLKVDMSTKKLASADWKKIPIDSTIEPAPDVARLVSQWEGKVSKLVDVPIGESKRRIDGEELRLLMERAVSEELHTDLAFFNQGNLRDVLPQGKILARNVWNIFPFEDHIVIGKFKGSQLPKNATAGRTIDPEREYTLATTDYTAVNQSLPDELGSSGLVFPKLERLQRDVVIEWIKKQKVLP